MDKVKASCVRSANNPCRERKRNGKGERRRGDMVQGLLLSGRKQPRHGEEKDTKEGESRGRQRGGQERGVG